MTSKIDLTFVEPHQRDEIRRRIEAVERFNTAPGRAKAEEEAALLGLGVASFYRIVKAWNAEKHRCHLDRQCSAPSPIFGLRWSSVMSKSAVESHP